MHKLTPAVQLSDKSETKPEVSLHQTKTVNGYENMMRSQLTAIKSESLKPHGAVIQKKCRQMQAPDDIF